MNGKPYVREIRKNTWYLARRRDIHHMLHEISSLFIGAYGLLLVWGLRALAEGEGAYQLFLERLASPLSLGFHWLALAFTLFHSISWFGLTPKAMPVQIGENFVPGYLIAVGHYIAWIGVSLFILFIAGVFADG
jgi:fumarate reductase subunit C